MKKLLLMALMLCLSMGLLVVPSHTRATQAQTQVEITFIHIFGDPDDIRGQVVQELATQFMAQRQDIKVNIQTSPISGDYSSLLESVLRAADQGQAPHVVQLDEGATQFAVDSGKFIKITDVASEAQLAEIDDFLPSVLNFYKVEGNLWSVPWNSSNPLLYYNKDIFEAAGLDPEVAPRTFADVLAMCETIMSSPAAPPGGCINFPLTSWFPENWVAMQNALLVNNNNGRDGRATEVFFDSEAMLNVMTWWKELADRDFYNYSGQTGGPAYEPEGRAFLSKQFAMHINSTAGLSNFIFYSDLLRWELGVAPLPIPTEEATTGLVSGGGSLWLSTGHPQEEIDAARDFIFFMTSAENIAYWHKQSGYFPNRTGAIEMLEAEGFWEENPFYYVSVKQVIDTQDTPATSGSVIGPHDQVRNFLDRAVQSIIDSGEDPLLALQAAKIQADQALADYNANR